MMFNTKLKWGFIAAILLLVIITLLCFTQTLKDTLFFLPLTFTASFLIPGIIYISFAGIVLMFVVYFLFGSKAKNTLQTVYYSVLLTQATTVYIYAWLFIIAENTKLLKVTSADYFNSFTVGGFVCTVCSFLIIIAYNIIRIVHRKKRS